MTRQTPRSSPLAHPGAAALLLIMVAGVALLAVPATADDTWRHAAIWDDGLAEFCAYQVDWRRYGTTYPGRALLILVKEPWAPDLDVKADRPRPGGFEVLKLNHTRDVPTGIYTYHQMASVYLRRDDGSLRKLVTTSSEACGISTARVGDDELHLHSYFDGVGDQSRPYPEGALPEDGLPAFLRDYLVGDPPATLTVLPTLLDGRLATVEPFAVRVERSEIAAHPTPDGEVEAIELTLTPVAGGAPARYRFARTAPHPVLEIETFDGSRYRLARCGRIAYWNMSRPGDEAWLPEEVRE